VAQQTEADHKIVAFISSQVLTVLYELWFAQPYYLLMQ